MTIFEYATRHQMWSMRTFGPGKKTLGLVAHIEKELAEIKENPTDLEEWIDVMILAIDGYWRHGGTTADLLGALAKKQEVNMARKWPPVNGSEDLPIEHLRNE